jgi:PEP-CTERM motif
LIASSGVSIAYDGTAGNPSGSALLSINDNTTAPNADYLYQIVPVTVGQQYQLNADWSGDLYNGSTGRNWAEVYLAFGPTAAALDPTSNNPGNNTGNIQYKRATDGSNSSNPNTGTTYDNPWTWQSITDSPVGTSTPADGIFTASDNYMLLAFNLGGHAGAGLGYYNVDNVSVVAVPEPCTLALIGLAGLGLGGLRRFRR